jgi:2-dehydropantoate 2-reductase
MSAAQILIAGAGALGSLYGGFLRRHGHAVTLLGRPAHLDAVRRAGLRIGGIWGEHLVEGFSTAASAAEVRGELDLIVLAVKSYDVAAVASSLAGRLAPEGSVLCLQNGLGHLEVVGEVFGRSHTLGAPVLIGATIPEPGRVTVTVYAKPVKIGAPWGDLERAEHWAEILARAGIPSEPTDRLLPYLWEKVLYNAALNPLGALLRVPYGRLGEKSETRKLMDRVLDEAYDVARADGVDLLWESREQCRRHFYETLLPPTVGHRSSMLQDIEGGRRTEIDAINGYVCARGAANGVATPINDIVTALIHAAERH